MNAATLACEFCDVEHPAKQPAPPFGAVVTNLHASPENPRPRSWPMTTLWCRILCWATGHNLVGVDLPRGWSQQRCRTCGQPVDAYGKEW